MDEEPYSNLCDLCIQPLDNHGFWHWPDIRCPERVPLNGHIFTSRYDLNPTAPKLLEDWLPADYNPRAGGI